MTLPSSSFHIHAVASSEPASSTAPRGCHATQLMPCVGPSSGAPMSVPALACHTRTVPSSPPVASSEPSMLNASAPTVSVWPSSRNAGASVPSRHRCATSSPPPVASISGCAAFTATEKTGSACASSRCALWSAAGGGSAGSAGATSMLASSPPSSSKSSPSSSVGGTSVPTSTSWPPIRSSRVFTSLSVSDSMVVCAVAAAASERRMETWTLRRWASRAGKGVNFSGSTPSSHKRAVR